MEKNGTTTEIIYEAEDITIYKHTKESRTWYAISKFNQKTQKREYLNLFPEDMEILAGYFNKQTGHGSTQNSGSKPLQKLKKFADTMSNLPDMI